MSVKMWVDRIWVWAWMWAVCQIVPPTAGYFMGAAEEPEPNTAIVEALNRMAQVGGVKDVMVMYGGCGE